MRSSLRDNWKITLPLGIVGAAILFWLVFVFFGFQTAFFDDKVDEGGPEFASGAGASGLESDALSNEDAAAMKQAMDQDGTALNDEADDPMPDMPEPDVLTLDEGSFVDRSHPAEGTALVLNDGTEQRFLRFEDFATDNGPDLNVYLSTAPADAPADRFDDDFVDLGNLKGNIGNQNYEIPADVDLDRFTTVVIWCVRFGVAFGAADLA